MTESFFIYKLEYLFIFSDISFKIPESNPLHNKKKPCLKYHLIFFFCNFIIDFSLFGRCSTKGAALLKEPHNTSSKELDSINSELLK